MVKIVINTGQGFDLTHKAVMRYAELKGITLTSYQYNTAYGLFERCENPNPEKLTAYFVDLQEHLIPTDLYIEKFFSIYEINRTDPVLIQVVEELKDSEHLELKIVDVPDNVQWNIEESDMGPECVREVSRWWR